MKHSVIGGFAIMAGVLLIATPEADAGHRRDVASGIVGGMSAAAVMGGIPYYPSYGNYYPSYPAPVYYVPPAGPPPGCVIRAQKVWDGKRWHVRKLRICH